MTEPGKSAQHLAVKLLLATSLERLLCCSFAADDCCSIRPACQPIWIHVFSFLAAAVAGSQVDEAFGPWVNAPKRARRADKSADRDLSHLGAEASCQRTAGEALCSGSPPYTPSRLHDLHVAGPDSQGTSRLWRHATSAGAEFPVTVHVFFRCLKSQANCSKRSDFVSLLL